MQIISRILATLSVCCWVASCSATPEPLTTTTSALAICDADPSDCAWQPDATLPLPTHVSNCGGALGAGQAEIHSTGGRCARLTGRLATAGQPIGYRFSSLDVQHNGWKSAGGANEYMTWYTGPERISYVTVGAGSHMLLCSGDVQENATQISCPGGTSYYTGRVTSQSNTSTLSFSALGILLAQSTAQPPNCPYVASGVGRPVVCDICSAMDRSGYSTKRCRASLSPTDNPIVLNIATGEPCYAPADAVVGAPSVLVYNCAI